MENHDNDTRHFRNGNRACMDRLAAYEDTGLEPAEAQRLARGKAIYEAYDSSKLAKADQYIERLEADNAALQAAHLDECANSSRLQDKLDEAREVAGEILEIYDNNRGNMMISWLQNNGRVDRLRRIAGNEGGDGNA